MQTFASVQPKSHLCGLQLGPLRGGVDGKVSSHQDTHSNGIQAQASAEVARGKHYLAPKILERMPRHLTCVELFAGGLQVLLARNPDVPRFWVGATAAQRGVCEVANDINGGLMNFWSVLRVSFLRPQEEESPVGGGNSLPFLLSQKNHPSRSASSFTN